MAKLPVMDSDKIKKQTMVQFGGLNRNVHAGNGEIVAMHNMTSDEYPLLTSRLPRQIVKDIKELGEIQGAYIHDGVYFVMGGDFYSWSADEGLVNHNGEFSEGEKIFTTLGERIVILPDKKYFDKSLSRIGEIEYSWTGSARFLDGTYEGQPAKGNTITMSGSDIHFGSFFKVGDGVSISGSSKEENNKTIIVREIPYDGNSLVFYENSFTVTAANETITIKREMPDMDYICEHDNRLWGCKGSTIYSSKLGDIFNWNVFDDISTSSYAVDVGSAGEFTGCAAYQGHVIFFKEDCIYRVYGSKPSNYQVVMSATQGVKTGSYKSIALGAERLFYLSRAGVMMYTGGTPQNISSALWNTRHSASQAETALRWVTGVGGSDDIKYYISAVTEQGVHELLAYDTRYGTWHREDDTEAMTMGTYSYEGNTGLYMVDSGGSLILISGNGNAEYEPEESLQSMAEFGDFTYGGPNREGIGKVQLRLELIEGANTTVYINFDGGEWQEVKTISDTGKQSYYLPIIPRRCDHFRLKIEGTGKWRLHSLTSEVYSGSEI